MYINIRIIAIFILAVVFAILGIVFKDSNVVISISPNQPESKNNGELVHIKGPLFSKDLLEDQLFSFKYSGLSIKRVVEIFLYEEVSEDNISTNSKSYSYLTVWSDKIIDSDEFQDKNYTNPENIKIPSYEESSNEVRIGDFLVDYNLLAKHLDYERVKLLEGDYKNLNEVGQKAFKLHDGYFYYGIDPDIPEIGDMRVSYWVVKPKIVNIVAKQDDKKLVSDNSFFEVFNNIDDLDQVLKNSGIEAKLSVLFYVFELLALLLFIFLGYIYYLIYFDKEEEKKSLDDIEEFEDDFIVNNESDPTQNLQDSIDEEFIDDDLENSDEITEEEKTNVVVPSLDDDSDDELMSLIGGDFNDSDMSDLDEFLDSDDEDEYGDFSDIVEVDEDYEENKPSENASEVSDLLNVFNDDDDVLQEKDVDDDAGDNDDLTKEDLASNFDESYEANKAIIGDDIDDEIKKNDYGLSFDDNFENIGYENSEENDDLDDSLELIEDEIDFDEDDDIDLDYDEEDDLDEEFNKKDHDILDDIDDDFEEIDFEKDKDK